MPTTHNKYDKTSCRLCTALRVLDMSIIDPSSQSMIESNYHCKCMIESKCLHHPISCIISWIFIRKMRFDGYQEGQPTFTYKQRHLYTMLIFFLHILQKICICRMQKVGLLIFNGETCNIGSSWSLGEAIWQVFTSLCWRCGRLFTNIGNRYCFQYHRFFASFRILPSVGFASPGILALHWICKYLS